MFLKFGLLIASLTLIKQRYKLSSTMQNKVLDMY